AYTRTPAEGRWKDSGDTVSDDDIVVFEVMVDIFETTWWRTYRKTLEKRFGQKNIVLRDQDYRVLCSPRTRTARARIGCCTCYGGKFAIDQRTGSMAAF